MIRKLSLAALAAVALSGCVTGGYGYRGGAGDYYYGRSSSSYYGYGAPYGSVGYGYPGGWYGSVGYGTRYYRGPYRHGYGYGPYYGPYYYDPRYGGHYGSYYPPYRRPVVVRPPHPHKPRPPHVEPPDDPDRPGRTGIPWRDLDELRGPRPSMPTSTPARPEVAQSPMPGRLAPPVRPQPRAETRPRPTFEERSDRRRAGADSGNRIQEETP